MHQLAVRLFAPGISLVVVGIAVAIYLLAPAMLEAGWIKEARAVHAAWVETDRIAGADEIGGSAYLAGIRALGPPPRIPDLTLANLRLARIVHIGAADDRSEAIHAGYVERLGCRLSLWISRAGRDDEPAARDGAYGWTAGGLRYVLVARGFPQDRLDVIAYVVRRAAEEDRPPSVGEAQALRLGAALHPPCRP